MPFASRPRRSSSSCSPAATPNVNSRDQALADESERYAEQTGKIETAADRAAQAKITAAQRAGQAIDAENAKLARQAALYDRMAGRTAQPDAPPPAGAPTNPVISDPAATAAAAAAETPGADVVSQVFDAAVVNAINSQTERLSGDLAGVKKAIEDLGPRIGKVETAVRNIKAAVR